MFKLASGLVVPGLLLALAGCGTRDVKGDDRGPARDGNPGLESGPARDGGPPGSCAQLAVAPSVSLADPEAGDQFYAAAAWSSSGPVALWQRKAAQGLRMARLSSDAALLGPIQTVWGDGVGPQQPKIAVSGDVMAVAFLSAEGSNSRLTCVLGLLRLSSGASIKTPFRVSDAPSGTTVLGEVGACDVAPAEGGFAVVWSQVVDDKNLAWSLFAQRFDEQGNPQGTRLTVATSASKGLSVGGSLAFDGKRLFISHLDKNEQPILSSIAAGQLSSVSLAGGAIPAYVRPDVQWAGKLLLRWSDQVAEIDSAGKILVGPAKLSAEAAIGRVAGGLLIVYQDEFLLAQRLDEKFQKQGTPVGLSTERTARLRRLVSAPDGSRAVAFYFDQGFRAVALRCGETAPPPPGPGQCPTKSSVTPLDDGCQEAVCYAVIRLDYKSLGLKGYAIVGAPYKPTDAAAAKLAAEAVFKQYAQYLPSPLGPSLSPAQAGLYLATVSPGDFGGICLIGVDSGVAVAAGSVVWMGHGNWWLPASWQPVDALSCGSSPVAAQQTYAAPGSCGTDLGPGSAYTTKDALTLALRTNLAAHYASLGSFSAYAMLYTPSTGGCDPGVAELVVILSQRRK